MIEKIPFTGQETPEYDVLAGASPIAMNVMADGMGVVRRRPGITSYSGAPSTVVDSNGLDGLYITTHGDLYAVGSQGPERPIYSVTGAGATKISNGASPHGLRGTLRPVFAEAEMLIAVAGGSFMQKIVLADGSSDRLGGDPPKATHVIMLNNRFLANDVAVDRSAVRFTEPFGGLVSYAGAEDWSYGGFGTSGYFTAQSRPDDVVGLYETTSEASVMGLTTTQIFRPDPELTFAPVVTIENGLSAPYSVIRADGAFFWLDNLRRFVLSTGQGIQVLSDEIKSLLDGLTSVTDCFGYRVILGSMDAVVWTFPTDRMTVCYQKGLGWVQWSGWNALTGNWKLFPVTGHCLRQDRSENVVSTSAGKIGSLSLDVETDLGEPIRAYIETGYLNHNSDSYKFCKCVRLNLRRGETQNSYGPQAWLSFRDRPGAWANIPVDLGASGDREIVVQFHSLGTYRRRQWRFEYSGSESLALVSATEEFDIVGS